MQKLKVNVTFQLEVPIQTDSVGRRKSITDQVSPYISDYFNDLKTAMCFVKYPDTHRLDWGSEARDNYDAQQDFDLVERMGSCYKAEHLLDPETDEARIRWEKQKDLECWDHFGMGWKEFKTLSWSDQAKLREAKNIVWENGNWVKKGSK